MSSQTITFTVKDMHCESCPKLITLDLQDLDGVQSVDASLSTHQVTVTYDPDKVSQDTLAATITNSGYTPQLKEA